MIFRIRYGHCWRVIYRGAKEYRERWLQIIVDFQCCFLDIRTGAPWRDLPPDYGGWSNTHRRFIRWHDKGIWEKLLEILIDDPDYEWLMIDASHCKVHPHASGARGGNQDMSRTKGGSTPKYIWLWMRMVCRSESLSRKMPLLIARKLAT